MNKYTDFGYKQVSHQEKTNLVNEVFSSVAPKYDLMNDLLSGGLHRFWKWFTIETAGIRENMNIVDLSCGSGDLLLKIGKKMNKHGSLYGVDPSVEMLQQARIKMANNGLYGFVELVEASAEDLPMEENSIDIITCSFGFRNTTDKIKSLKSCLKALKTGGKMIILEFSHPTSSALKSIYDGYSNRVLPTLGKLVVGDKDSYKYLFESIRMHPTQEEMKKMMEDNGFDNVKYTNMNDGIVAIHTGYKL